LRARCAIPKRIQEDHKRFRDVVSGRTRRELKRLIKSGAIVRQRPKGGKVTISIPQIDIPHFVHGDSGEGIGRGPGKKVILLAVTHSPVMAIKLEIKKARAFTFKLTWRMFLLLWKKS